MRVNTKMAWGQFIIPAISNKGVPQKDNDIVSLQKQPSQVICKKRCFKRFHKFNWKTPVLESLFNKVAGFKA